GAELWLDGGHNAHAGRALAQALDALQARAPRSTIIVAGMLANKDSGGFLEPLASRVAGLVAVPVHGSRSSREPAELAQEARVFQMKAQAAGSLPEAMEIAIGMQDAPRILICGSLYLAGEALALSDALPD
ncbi:MAG TPA: bifunctional folylpolyglutamate synthase/dihydrofolate synthase, partial [Caulobacterales bacterium]|nr:bifunctional folylpolyglutamate synthase/dihydrofolate synthase [Caulobacterales bacterium]